MKGKVKKVMGTKKVKSPFNANSIEEWTVEVGLFSTSISRGRKRGSQKLYSFYEYEKKVQHDYYVLEKGEKGVSRLAWGRASVETHYHIQSMLPEAVAIPRTKRPRKGRTLRPDNDGNEQKRLL